MQKQAITHVTLSIAIACIATSWPQQKAMAGPEDLIWPPTPNFSSRPEDKPWRTPKGDAKVDCTVLRLKIKNKTNATKSAEKATDRFFQSRKAGEDWTKSEASKKLFREYRDADRIVEIAKLQTDLAVLNVAKHLNYEESRLKEMWEYRTGSPAWENLIKTGSSDAVLREIGLPFSEALHFCWFTFWS